MTEADTLTATIRIAAPPAVIFPYLIEPELIVTWIGQWADLQPEPGGLFALDFENTAARGRYVEVEPPTRVVFTWGIPGNDRVPPGSSTVEIVLTADGSETLVELFHRGLPADQRANHLTGWTECLDRLAARTGR